MLELRIGDCDVTSQRRQPGEKLLCRDRPRSDSIQRGRLFASVTLLRLRRPGTTEVRIKITMLQAPFIVQSLGMLPSGESFDQRGRERELRGSTRSRTLRRKAALGTSWSSQNEPVQFWVESFTLSIEAPFGAGGWVAAGCWIAACSRRTSWGVARRSASTCGQCV